MACPYFFPLSEAEGLKQPARSPLGVIYHGRCELGGSGAGDACNFGYAAGRCAVFPCDAEADAVRFTTLNGRTLYVLEKTFSPVRHGDIEELQGTLARQAEVFGQWASRLAPPC